MDVDVAGEVGFLVSPFPIGIGEPVSGFGKQEKLSAPGMGQPDGSHGVQIENLTDSFRLFQQLADISNIGRVGDMDVGALVVANGEGS